MVNDLNYDQYKGYSEYLYSLEQLKWKVFGTVTFREKSKRKSTKISTDKRNDDFIRLINNCCYKLNVDAELVPYFWRHESSLLDGWHIHFIIADCKTLSNFYPITICGELNSSWHRDFRGIRGINGTSQIEPFDETKPGLKYICKKDKYNENTEDGRVNYFCPSNALLKLREQTHIGGPSVISCDHGEHSQDIQRSSPDNTKDFR
jgi:hypothetical protein